jgi:hypothetical protein
VNRRTSQPFRHWRSAPLLLAAGLLPPLAACQSVGQRGEAIDAGQSAAAFPEAWFGTWRGPLFVQPAGRPERELTEMTLRIAPTDDSRRFGWSILYGRGQEQQVRNYALVVVDAPRGHYRIDEQNGIVLDCYRFGNTLCSQYEVQENLLTVAYHFEPDTIRFELTSARAGAAAATGGDGTPAVTSYPLAVRQRAELTRAAGD